MHHFIQVMRGDFLKSLTKFGSPTKVVMSSKTAKKPKLKLWTPNPKLKLWTPTNQAIFRVRSSSFGSF